MEDTASFPVLNLSVASGALGATFKFFVRLTWSEMALPSILSHLFGNSTFSQAHYPPGTLSSFCCSNTPTPFPALGLYKPAQPHVWKVLPHSFEASPSHILTFRFQLKCSIGREALLDPPLPNLSTPPVTYTSVILFIFLVTLSQFVKISFICLLLLLLAICLPN